jgi:multicomponent Na+:H+ antiporter subunit E
MTMRLLIALVFVVAWILVTGSLTVANLLFGLVLGGAALWMVREARELEPIRVRPLPAIRLAGLFVVELLKSGWRVATLVVRRDMGLDPGIVAYPLRVTRDVEITLLANLITLTPGTLSVDVSDDRRTLFVHCVAVGDPAAVIADIRDGFEARILETFR